MTNFSVINLQQTRYSIKAIKVTLVVGCFCLYCTAN